VQVGRCVVCTPAVQVFAGVVQTLSVGVPGL